MMILGPGLSPLTYAGNEVIYAIPLTNLRQIDDKVIVTARRRSQIHG